MGGNIFWGESLGSTRFGHPQNGGTTRFWVGGATQFSERPQQKWTYQKFEVKGQQEGPEQNRVHKTLPKGGRYTKIGMAGSPAKKKTFYVFPHFGILHEFPQK